MSQRPLAFIIPILPTLSSVSLGRLCPPIVIRRPPCDFVGGDAHIAPPRPQARNTPRLPLRGRQREAPERDVVRPHPRCSSVGGGCPHRPAVFASYSGRGRAVRPYTRLPIAFAPSVRADVGIRPYEITGGVCIIRTGGQSRPSLRTVYRPCTLSLTCHSEGAKRPWESVPLFISTAALAATYLCRSAAKARFDNRPNPRRVFPKREGRSPPSLVAQGWGIFKGEGRSKLPSPLNGVLWILSFAKERK